MRSSLVYAEGAVVQKILFPVVRVIPFRTASRIKPYRTLTGFVLYTIIGLSGSADTVRPASQGENLGATRS